MEKILLANLCKWPEKLTSSPVVTHISSTKFEEHCSNISGDILDSVFNSLNRTIYDVIMFQIASYKNVNISKTNRDIPKRKMAFFFTLKSLSNTQQLFFTS